MKYLFLLLLFFIPMSQADAVWFSSDWDYKVKVEINPNKVGSSTAVTSFPVYVDLAGMPTSFWTNASNTGADIRVVESDDTTETAFEVVTFATTTKRGELHFMADSLGTTSTSTFYIYYGNATATAYAVTDTYGRNNVWAGYNVVYHTLDVNDSTASGQTLTNNGSVSFASDAKLGKGASGFIVNSSKNLARSSVTTIGTGAFSYTGWLMATSITGGTNKAIFSHTGDVNTLLVEYSGSKIGWYSGGYRITGSTTLVANTWYHYALIGNGGADGSRNVKAYINGVQEGSTYTANYNISLTNVKYGAHVSASSEGFINGNLDEGRKMIGTALSTSWLITEYNNQSSTSTFFYIGLEETNATSSPETPTYPILNIQDGIQMSGGILISM
jgi:hypothetical protein